MDGNKNQGTSDLGQLFLLTVDKTMEKTHVSDVCKVISINDKEVKLQLINQPGTNIYAYCPNSVKVDVDDIVLVLYTDTDTRLNLKRLEEGKEPLDESDGKTTHSLDYGIIILNFKGEE